jgi:ABC-type transport system substrate-binding protein
MPAMKYLVATGAPAPDLYIPQWVKGLYDFGMRTAPYIKAVMADNPKVKSFDAPDPCPRVIAMNEERKPLDDVQFRAALSLLLDRTKTANSDSTPGQVQVVPWPYSGTPATTFYDPADADKYDVVRFDPAKAAKILDDAGYKLVNGKRLGKDGKPIQLSAISMLPEYVAWTMGLILMEQEAAKLGIQIDVRVLEPGTLMDNFNKGDYDMSFYWQCPLPSDPLSVYEQLLPEHYTPVGKSANWLNIFRYKAPDDLIAAIKTIQAGNPDDPVVQNAFKQAYAIVMRDHVWISEYSQMYSFAVNTEYWTGLAETKLWNYWNPNFRLLLDVIKPVQ